MNLLLSKILTYLNGAMVYDSHYRLCKFIIRNYLELEDLSFDEVCQKSEVDQKEILDFCKIMGFNNYEDFKSRLIRDHMIRLDQIRARMLGISSEQLIEEMEDIYPNKIISDCIFDICEAIFKAKRIVLIGALYPLSIAVEFQTDLVTFGKPVFQYHNFDQTIQFDEDDVIIFISATGRAMNSVNDIKEKLRMDLATTILITQNTIYTEEKYQVSDYVIQIPGKFDGINFNYQIMKIFDIFRVHYYQQYYL